MTQTSVSVLNQGEGNAYIVQIAGRRFPAIAIQGDTFFAMTNDLKTALSPGNPHRKDLLAGVVSRLDEALDLYRETQRNRGEELPWRE